MNKALSFLARHVMVTVVTILISFVAVIGSAYGFSKIADITSVGSNIPEVKTVEVLSAESKLKTPNPTNSISPVIPSQNPNNNNAPQDIITSSQQNIKLNADSTITPTPVFEKDDDTENLTEDNEIQDFHLEDKSKDENK